MISRTAYLLVLLLSVQMVFAADTTVPAHKDDDLRIEYPSVLGGMQYMGVHKYEMPEYGYRLDEYE